MIIFKNVEKTFLNGCNGLSDINLHIQPGEFVYLVGPSGAGKSTLLNMIFCAEQPTSGSVYVNNVSLQSLKKYQIPLLRRHIGVVFQDFKLLPRRTVFENVAFALRFLGLSRSRLIRQTNQVIELVGLTQKSRCLPSELSGGEQQRICIARAIVNNPPILLADEPTGSLDPDTSWEIMQLLNRINARNTTVVVATHDKGIVDDVRRRVIGIKSGAIVRDEALGAYAV